ncbi:MAG: hydrogenase maturation nickel metallochaperone HypA [Planctomycetaceae bacterium]
MHELSLARALLKQVKELSASNRNGELRRVRLTVGEFSGVETELLESALRESTFGTSLEGVELSITRVPLTAQCKTCGAKFRVERFCFVCPDCGAGGTDVIGGEEIVLESVTFEELEP